jgi:hypothetical protein
MQHQQRTNEKTMNLFIPEGEWRPCKRVTFQDGLLHCVLDSGRTYVLAEAYDNDLHIRFANANSDEEMVSFIRAWGPLYVPSGQIPPDGRVLIPRDYCTILQREMKALIEALSAFKHGKGEREALGALLDAENALDEDKENTSRSLARAFGITQEVQDWLNLAGLSDVRAALDYVVGHALSSVSCSIKLSCRQGGRRRRVEAGWELLTLEDALHWMVWYDEFTNHPVVCCAECREVFRGETARARKYCSDKCGHRATARVAMKKKRKAERAGGK